MAKLAGDEKKSFLRDKLEEQRHFLKSIRDFVSGDLSEAVRLATAIRVLVHETGNSAPLLKQLTANYLQLDIMDMKPEKQEKLPPGIMKATVMVVPVSLDNRWPVVFESRPLRSSRAPSILGKWWERPS